MSRPPRGVSAPTVYELRLGGHVDEHWSTWFDGLTLTHEDDGTTILRGAVADQAELHGILAKVRDIRRHPRLGRVHRSSRRRVGWTAVVRRLRRSGLRRPVGAAR